MLLRRCLPLLLVVSVACKNDGGETESDSASTPASTGSATGSSGGTGGSETADATGATTQPTGSASGSMSDSASSTPTSETGIMTTTESDPTTDADPTTASSAPTGVEPVPCDGPEGCTDMGEGDLEPFVLPFFRGTVCVSDAVQPGDALALAVTTCAHPCLKVGGYAFKWVNRCTGGQGIDCEIGLALFHPDSTGAACPPDVFGEFDPALCEDAGPILLTIKPPPTEGAAKLLMPFLSNDDVTAIDGGQNDADSVWGFIDSHAQADERRIALEFSADNDPAPAECGEGVPGCTCAKIGLP